MQDRKRNPSANTQSTRPRRRPQTAASKIRKARGKQTSRAKNGKESAFQVSKPRKQAEEALRQQSEQLRFVIDHANDAIFYLDLNGIIQWASRQAAVLTGRPMNDLVGSPVMSVLTPEAAIAAEARLAAVRRGKTVPPMVELEVLRPDGTLAIVEANIASVYENGTIIGRLLVARDITERKRAEEALRKNQQRMELALNGAELGLWDIHIPTGSVVYNRRWAEMLEYTIEDIEPHVRSWEKLVHPDDWPRVSALWNAHLARDTVLYQTDHRLRAKSGEWKWIQTYGRVLERDRDGKPLRALGIHLDITERKLAEEERAKLYERLQASHAGLRTLSRRLMEVQEQERRHLASELHDEIGQALTAVKINLQQAMGVPASPEAGAHLEESVSILDRTLQQVRNLSLDLRPSLLDDLGLAPTLKWMADRHAQASGIKIVFSSDSDMENLRFPVEVELACYRTAQEALTNAIRHANATMIAIAMACSGNELRLTVRDDGIGFGLSDTLTQAREGKSAGLLGIFERVSLLGGQVDIQSRHGNGTQVHARFPLVVPHMPDTAHP